MSFIEGSSLEKLVPQCFAGNFAPKRFRLWLQGRNPAILQAISTGFLPFQTFEHSILDAGKQMIISGRFSWLNYALGWFGSPFWRDL